MNRVGIMIDVSHPSKESMMQTLALTKAPIIASHSAVRALADVSRNLDDEQLLALKKNGGVMQIVAFASYVKTDSPERTAALDALRKEFSLPPGTALRRPAAAADADARVSRAATSRRSRRRIRARRGADAPATLPRRPRAAGRVAAADAATRSRR